MSDWASVAVVVRSQCHEATWIGHVQNAGFDDTPAGPLRVVKAAVVDMAVDADEEHRWCHRGDSWVLEVSGPDVLPAVPHPGASSRTIRWFGPMDANPAP